MVTELRIVLESDQDQTTLARLVSLLLDHSAAITKLHTVEVKPHRKES